MPSSITHSQLRFELAVQAIQKMAADYGSYNKIAKALGLNSAHISHLLGQRTHLSHKLDAALVRAGGLPAHSDPVLADPCPDCGQLHAVDWCVVTHGKPMQPRPASKRIRRPRFSAAADDPKMAMDQIEKYYPGLFSFNPQNYIVEFIPSSKKPIRIKAKFRGLRERPPLEIGE